MRMRHRIARSASATVLARAVGVGVGLQAAALAASPPVLSLDPPNPGLEQGLRSALPVEELSAAPLDDAAVSADGGDSGDASPSPKKVWIGVVTFATLAGSAYNSFSDGPNRRFHFTNEGFFGQNTYAGGGDKASHFVSYYIVARLLGGVYAELGMKTDSARLLGAATSVAAGLVTELGDGRGKYGFSYEDLLLDSLGAATQLGIAHYGLGDLIGFSAGLVPAPNEPCCPYGGTGKNYTQEIYSGDLRIAGLAHRAGFEPGPARFLLLSATYGTKGYPYSNPDIRERQIGLFVGINFVEVLRAAGVPEKEWWGKTLYFLFDVIRIPYTQIGYQYDINHGRWHGPTIGDAFPGATP
jgi:Predicted periplasmic lipoprotein (DUF2279)